jgi:aryl-alcohol dehydrogenase-like predicted oxidoreductase
MMKRLDTESGTEGEGALEKRRIGSLEVTVVGLGCNNFGGRLDAEATAEVAYAALDAGINFFDTADVYGGTKSEEYLGQALRGRRDGVILATKFGHRVAEGKEGAKPEYVRQAAEDSLRRLQTDRIDLYQLHRPDSETPIAATLGALNELVQAGKVREIGCSNFSAEQLREAASAVPEGGARFASVQNEYSLFHRDPEKEVLPECERTGLAFIPYFPLASGLLTGKYRKGQPIPEGTRLDSDRGREELAKKLDTVEALARFAEARGHTLLDLAFSWLLAHSAVSSVIAGATKPEQARSNAAAHWRLTNADLQEIDSILAGQ